MDRLDEHLDRELEELSRVADGAEFAEGHRGVFREAAARFGNRTRFGGR